MKKILVIDESNSELEILSFFLKKLGFQVFSAQNGTLGLHLAQQYLPDLILCDINMPQVNGYQVLKELKTTWTICKIPFIFVTSETSTQNRLRAEKLGASGYLVKPVSFEELLAVINNALEIKV